MSRVWLCPLVLGSVVSFPLVAAPSHFPGCEQKDVAFFANAKDRETAVEVCRTAEGYRFSWGPIDGPDIRLLINRNEVYSAEVEEDRGVMISDYVIASGLKGKSHLYFNAPEGQFGDWAKTIELDDQSPEFVNELYCVTETPCRYQVSK